MSLASHEIQPGQKVLHTELGEGVVVGSEPTGYITVFFRAHGERQVPAETLSLSMDHFDRIINGFSPASPERLEHLWLALEAEVGLHGLNSSTKKY
jgi:hypothetical protein